MAKKTYQKVRMIPEDDPSTGTVYMAMKPTKGMKVQEKLRLKKYDPVIMKHVWFVEKKLPSHRQ